MNPGRILELLEQVREGTMEVEAAMERLKSLPFEDLGFATIDHHRALRKGFPEVVFCEGKTTEQVIQIARRIIEWGSTLLATRVHSEVAKALQEAFPSVEYHALARVAVVTGDEDRSLREGLVLVISAGTSDIPVAEEAAVTAEVMGNRVERLFDVGVAGIHRLLAHQELLQSASVIVVVAGMEGALSSVVGGLVDVPVIAVPTSVGYGASFHGLAALLGMLNSCASGVVVVNIDNGFGAGYAATLINRHKASVGALSGNG
ncbi:MAG TPA: nickel pincer cofactor biosynthesis protein LarB [Desulfobacterales bacterium]|nr:nickel pincer cofactor biosynthesis protein LarB [Desulfobacterales bacterium]